MIFSFFKKIGFWGILDPPYYGIGAIIRMDREMFCLLYAGFSKHRLSGLMLSISQNLRLRVRLSVRLSVRVFTLDVLFKRLFVPTSQSQMSNIF